MSNITRSQRAAAICFVLLLSSALAAQPQEQTASGNIWTVSLYESGQMPAKQGNVFTIGLFSQKPQLVTVPSLSGMTWDEASKTLSDLKLVAIKNNASGLSSDSVRNQSIPAGKQVYTGSSVKLGLVTTVPNIVGKTFSEAYSMLTSECGFKMKYNQNLSSEFTVTHQDPKAGSVLARGQSVSAMCLVLVPKVEGLTVSEAQAKLSEAKLNNSLPKIFESSDLVLKQTNAGRTVPALSVVKLVPGVKVPNLIGMNVVTANAELVRVGIKGNPRTTTIATPNQFMHGRTTVIGQGYRAGQYIARSQSMNVNLNKLVYVAPRPILSGNQNGTRNGGTIKNGINGGDGEPRPNKEYQGGGGG